MHYIIVEYRKEDYKMTELQEVELNLFKEFLAFCDKHNLKYYIIGGTLLGSIRHKGFIPWDDDIDIGMPRKDYDKFCELASKEFTGDIFLQTWKTDKNYPYNFAKLRDSRTTYIEKTYKFNNMNHGAWIDIFPMDAVCKKQPNFWMQWRVTSTWVLMFFSAARCWLRVPRLNKYFLLDIILDILLFPMLMLNIGHWHNRVIDHKLRRYNYDKCEYIANYEGCSIGREIVKKEWFGEGTIGEFEGLKVVIPENSDAYLKAIYHNYMELPPEDKRVLKHNTSGEDIHVSYKDYHKNYRIWKN